MLPVLLALMLCCLSQACQGLPAIQAPTYNDVIYSGAPNPGFVAVTVQYSQWFSDSSAFLSVNEVTKSLQISRSTFNIELPADGNVTVTTTNPHGLSCTPNQVIALADAERGVVVDCDSSLSFVTGQAASFVLGEPDMGNVNQSASPHANVFYRPWGITSDSVLNPNWLFVSDELNNRVLAFGLPITQNQPDAQFVLGQTSFTGANDAASQATISQPLGLDGANGMLLVADGNNNRVLIYHQTPNATGTMPDGVIGQSTFGTAATGCNSESLQFPMATAQANGRLYIADFKNNRVLYWKQVPTQGAAAPADGVLGQPSVTSCTVVQPTSASTFAAPRALHWDGNYLYVADADNNRILIYEGAPEQGDMPKYLIGQSDFTGNANGINDVNLNTPKGVVADATSIFVSDTYNSRVLAYKKQDVFAANGAAAVHPYLALGQSATNDATPVSSTAPQSAMTLAQPSGLVIVGSQLFVSDTFNQRVLIFDSQQ